MLKHQKPLTIMQYNTNNSRNSILFHFLQEVKQADPQPDILAIQKLWRKDQKNTTCTTKFYHIVHAGVVNTKVCFYINKAIDTNKWTFTHHLADVCMIKLKDQKQTIQIHNIYNPQQTNNSLHMILELLKTKKTNIIRRF